jgi:hypothetical protein
MALLNTLKRPMAASWPPSGSIVGMASSTMAVAAVKRSGDVGPAVGVIGQPAKLAVVSESFGGVQASSSSSTTG